MPRIRFYACVYPISLIRGRKNKTTHISTQYSNTSSLNQPENNRYNSDHQQNVNQVSHAKTVETQEPKQPDDDQDNRDCIK